MATKFSESTILIIEDDQHINTIIFDVLTKENFQCTQAFSGSEAKLLLNQQEYALIILDLMLPGIQGEVLMSELRTELRHQTPVIVLSAKDQLDYKLNLFELGANDYVTKPFEVKELLARVHVHIRRSAERASELTYKHKELNMNCHTRTVTVKNNELTLTRQEYKILELLVKNPTRVFTKDDLYQLAWGDHYMGEDKTITVHISNIRHKIKTHDEAQYIETVWGIGFRLSK
ncbi:DNA-binding response regulator, OmpR family, contains REC and winged-helix (wHTH) domain [Amphibacillus marinus]|uniref:DNA-binding response regulator, OmpR family, contains REC and winged-helix (WHTH) domain n=1 Tax=Amphibacillus marinus TaxID=872970 RepID=A0A1H8T881_9BACI|nr:response regulator transcription factor [Amphibacillus marinus]SEO86956.1 DNA-binding response regulator, OmpR family, contains REC and winged-helix (wHTH) domain [Amphibacillus marinus]